MRQQLKKRSQGFTMIELVVTLLIIGIATAVAAPNLMRAMQTYRLNSGAQQVENALQAAKFASVRANTTQWAYFDTTNNTTSVGAATTAPATPLPPGIRFTTITGAAPTIISTAVTNAATIGGQQSNSATVAVSFPQVTGQTNFRQASFNSRGLPGPGVNPGTVHWVYLTNSQNELMAVTLTSAGSVQIWRWNSSTSTWSTV